MASLKFMSLLTFAIIFSIGNVCNSFPSAMPPSLPGIAPLPTSPSYGSTPSPYSYPAEPISSPGPVYYSPVPATPTYLPSPGPDPYGSAPTFPAVPAPEGAPISPAAPGPDACPPSTEFAPSSYSPGPISSAPYPSPQKHHSKAIKAAYWPSFDDFPASDIDASYFTHIYYAFLLLEPTSFKLNVTQFDQAKIPELIDTLRARNLSTKILLSIGGAGSPLDVFPSMASTKQTRAVFINSTIEVARKYGFDGVDLDWEFPANDQDMLNLALLFKQWRKALHHEARISRKLRLLLTSAVYYASKFTVFGEPRAYPADAITRYVDWINPMCYDYHGSWENFTGLPAALYDPNSNISTTYGIRSWIEAGVPPKQLVMGLPLYGRTWKLQDPNVNGIGARAVGVGPGGGELNYNQIVEFNADNKAIVTFDYQTVAYYSFAGDSWIGYDDVSSIRRKVEFAKSLGLSGYFFWALGQDKNWTISREASSAWGR